METLNVSKYNRLVSEYGDGSPELDAALNAYEALAKKARNIGAQSRQALNDVARISMVNATPATIAKHNALMQVYTDLINLEQSLINQANAAIENL